MQVLAPVGAPMLTCFRAAAFSAAGVIAPIGGLVGGGFSSQVTDIFTFVDDVAGSLDHKTFSVAVGNALVVFELTTGGPVGIGHVAVPYTANDTAATIVSAASPIVLSAFASLFAFLVFGGPGGPAIPGTTPANLVVLIFDPATADQLQIVADAPLSPSTPQRAKGGFYGRWLFNTWDTFVFQGMAGTGLFGNNLRGYRPVVWPVRVGRCGVRVYPCMMIDGIQAAIG